MVWFCEVGKEIKQVVQMDPLSIPKFYVHNYSFFPSEKTSASYSVYILFAVFFVFFFSLVDCIFSFSLHFFSQRSIGAHSKQSSENSQLPGFVVWLSGRETINNCWG